MRGVGWWARALLFTMVSGCAFFRQLGGTNTVDLEKADVKAMGVDVRKTQKTICPREKVQLAVFMDVAFSGEKEIKKVETWKGPRGTNKNGTIDFGEFVFQSANGRVDEDGWFLPNPNLAVTSGKEFEIKTIFKKRPDKFSMTTTYKPDYDCIKATGRDGKPGATGSAGAAGASGNAGTSGSYTTQYKPGTSSGPSTSTQVQGPGGNGSAGGPGGNGGRGGDGEPGPHLTVMLTLVKTAFYDRLVAARITGEIDDLLLFPPEVVLNIHANGGNGGAGGAGGKGGQGGAGGSGNPPGAKGADGANGTAGAGGNGGAGGVVDINYDPRFEKELRAAVRGSVAAGVGGSGSSRGQDGAPGRLAWLAGNVQNAFPAGIEALP